MGFKSAAQRKAVWASRNEKGEKAPAMSSKVDKKTLACNKPRRTPTHRTKSHIVKACEGGKEKIIRFGQQGVSTAGKKTDAKSKARRKSFKARHAKNIAKGKMSAAYWADKVKW